MLRSFQRMAAALALVGLLFGSAAPALAASEYDSQPSGTLVDILLLRPLGLGVTVVGAALMAPVALLMTVTGHPHEMGKPAEALVMAPARFTFSDPIGAH